MDPGGPDNRLPSRLDAGRPSETARRVAAYRLSFPRAGGNGGSPETDDALMREVADGLDLRPDPSMERYLRARTSFFDRVVLNAADRGVTQMVSLGAGYDGRSLRYSAPDRRWFEVDHPATSGDKLARVARLRATAAQAIPEPTFVAWDFARPGLAEALVAAGFDPDTPAQMISEGVAVYLEPAVLESLLGEARALAAPGTRLAISLSVGTVTTDRRARFRAGVGRLGEPVRSPPLTVPSAARLFAATGWQTVDISEKSASAGLCVLRPIWARHRRPPTIGRTGRFMEGMLHRERSGELAAHLERTYGIEVTSIRELDLGVHRVSRRDGTDWIARVSPPDRPVDGAAEDGRLLAALIAHGVPAETPAHDQPHSIHAGQGVLVTDYVAGRRAPATPPTWTVLGRLLGRLHRDPPVAPAADRTGGAWHHLVPQGSVVEELDAVRALFAATRGRATDSAARGHHAAIEELLTAAGDFARLPTALAHPDLVPGNTIADHEGGLTVIDWSGAGQAPRVVPLGCLLWAAAHRSVACVQAAVEGYAAEVDLSPAEMEALEDAAFRRPMVLGIWNLATARQPLDAVAAYLAAERARAGRAGRAAQASLARAVSSEEEPSG